MIRLRVRREFLSTPPTKGIPLAFRNLIRNGRAASAGIPAWALPFYWASAACILLFSGAIWLVAALCLSMRPLYVRRRPN